MNANEMADELLYRYADEGGNFYGDDIHKDVIQMLRQFGLAESIIKQQELQIQDLKDEITEWKMSYENCHRMCNGYGMN